MRDQYNFDLLSFNKQLKDQLAEVTKEKEVNNMKLFVMNDEAKVSVTLEAKYEKMDYYHGLSPKFDEVKLKEFLFPENTNSEDCGFEINNPDNFWRKIKVEQNKHEYVNLFVKDGWTKDKKSNSITIGSYCQLPDEMHITLLGRAILQMATHFGFSVKLSAQDQREFLQILKDCFSGIIEFPKEFRKEDYKNSLYWQFNDDFSVIYIKGIWPLSVVNEITQRYDCQNNTLILKSCGGNSSGELFSLLTFDKANIDKYHNNFDNVYYSGVMPKVIKIRYEEKPTAADKMKYIVFEVVRTTFATVDMLDNPAILSQPFFQSKVEDSETNDLKRSELMMNFDQHEDNIQNEYLYNPEYNPKSDCEPEDKSEIETKKESTTESEKIDVNDTDTERIFLSPTTDAQRDYEKWMIDNLNQYLERSLNSNTVAVSANIVTKDDYLLIGKRGELTIDNSQYYCSVNGQSEFRDPNVSFYRNSVFEDLPSMEFDSKYRIDLNNEIQREALAELGLPFFEHEWSYYGISYLSINNSVIDEQRQVMKRRMHFNVLTHNSTSYTFADINKSQKKATESFENERLRGIKIKVHPDVWAMLCSLGKSVIEFFIKYKSNIFILYFILSLFSPVDGIMNFSESTEARTITGFTRLMISNIMNLGMKTIIDILIFIFFIFTSWIERRRYKPIKELLGTKNFIIKFHTEKCAPGKESNQQIQIIKWKRIYETVTEKNLLHGFLRKKTDNLRSMYDESSIKIIVEKIVNRLKKFISRINNPFNNNKHLSAMKNWLSKELASSRANRARNEINSVHGIVYVMYSLHFYERVKTMKKPISWPILKFTRFKFINNLLSTLILFVVTAIIAVIAISYYFPDI
ncbi:hypothetical protein C8U37_10257 [Trichococcus patagoniensis]|uniref:Uncharacterized protein n=1 Tax=Trichococcus patagoniensis TaxID=382641 RepID=A0A2T5IQ44_9LACT|nr:hypothetical protein [Trichococcus patagoniensis]PTQ85954.1 hypothetical protein C8U37_10257 [Trichococcus patagoniensis]